MSPGCYDQYNDETLSSTLSANVHCYTLPFCRVLKASQDSSNCFPFFFLNPWSVSDQCPESVSAALIKAQLVCVLCTCLNVPYLSVFALCLSECSIIVCVCFVLVCIRCHCLYECKVYVCSVFVCVLNSMYLFAPCVLLGIISVSSSSSNALLLVCYLCFFL